MKRNLLTLIIGAVLVVIFALLLFVFQVRQSQVAVVTTFGKPTRPVGPGPHFKWPWPIEKVYTFDQRIQNFQDEPSEVLTADNVNLITSVYVGWRIADAKEFFPKFENGSTIEAKKMLASLLRNANSAVVGKHPLTDFVNANEKDLKFDTIENEIKAYVQSQLEANKCGIEITFLGVKKLGLPESVTETVFARMTSERNVLSSHTQYDGEAEAAKIKSSADRQAAEMLANAEAQAKNIQSEGEAQAARILPVLQQNPELASFLLKVTALEDSLKERSTLIFDQHTPPFDLFQGFSPGASRH